MYVDIKINLGCVAISKMLQFVVLINLPLTVLLYIPVVYNFKNIPSHHQVYDSLFTYYTKECPGSNTHIK